MKKIFIGTVLLFAVLSLSVMNSANSGGVHNLKIVALGDSITQGSALPNGVKNWTELLSEKYGVEIINAGIAGNSSAQGLARLEKDVLSYEPDYVIINFGMNDSALDGPGFNTVERFADNMTQIADRVLKSGAIPILVTPNPIIEGDETKYYYSRHNKSIFERHGGAQAVLNTYVQKIRDIAKRKGAPLADVNKEWVNYDSYSLLITLKNSELDDGVHPGLLGAELYFRVIGDCLDKLIH